MFRESIAVSFKIRNSCVIALWELEMNLHLILKRERLRILIFQELFVLFDTERVLNSKAPTGGRQEWIILAKKGDFFLFRYLIKIWDRPGWSYAFRTPRLNHKYFIYKKHVIQFYPIFDVVFSMYLKKRDDYISRWFKGSWSFYNKIRLRDANLNNVYSL